MQGATGLKVSLPAAAPFQAHAYVLKLEFSGQIPGLRPPRGAVAFPDSGYRGPAAVLAVGDYDGQQLELAGLGPRSLSSLRLAPGYQVTGYSGDECTGTSWTFTTNLPDLRGTGGNDKVASLRVQFAPSSYFRITNVTDGLALDSGGDVASGSDLKQWSWDNCPNLHWQVVEVGGGYYKLVNRANGMVADGWGAAADGSTARQAAWNSGSNQQWRITHRGDGRYDRQPHHRPNPRRRGQRALRLRHQAVVLRRQHQPDVDPHGSVRPTAGQYATVMRRRIASPFSTLSTRATA